MVCGEGCVGIWKARGWVGWCQGERAGDLGLRVTVGEGTGRKGGLGAGGGPRAPDTHCSSCNRRSPYCSRKYSARSSSSMMPRLMLLLTPWPEPYRETMAGGATGGSGVRARLLLLPSSCFSGSRRGWGSERLGKDGWEAGGSAAQDDRVGE